MLRTKRGFTLIELLVVIGILAILLAITLIAINPARQFGSANNTRRRSDVLQILNATHQYVAENNGQLPSSISGLAVDTATDFSDATDLAALCADLMPTYLPALPTDPSQNASNITDCTANSGEWGSTGYQITRDAANRVTVSALTTDNGADISVTR